MGWGHNSAIEQGEWGVTTHEYGTSSQGGKNVLELVVVIVQICEYTITTLHSERMDFALG